MKEKSILLQLFKETFILSAFTLGGGYVIVSLMQKRFVEELRWLKEDEMLDLVAVSQSSPGAVAINTSVALGYRMQGLLGALIAAFATALPPMIVLSGTYYVYDAVKTNQTVQLIMEGMQIGVTAIIVDVVMTMVIGIHQQKDWVNWVLFVSALLLSVVVNLNILIIVFIVTIIGLCIKKIQKG